VAFYPFVLAGAFASCLLFSMVSVAQEHDYAIPYSNASYSIDGRLDDEIWKAANKISLDVQTEPGENIPASVATDVFVVENGESFLVAFKAYDPEPNKIRAVLRDRDSAYSDDLVGVVLDTFNDQKRAFEFFVNPLGAQMDLIQDDVTDDEDDSWNATWDSDGRITDEGFIVEIAIPLNILRFRSGLDKQVWGIDLLRYRPRSDRERISNAKRDRNISCYLCQLKKIGGFSNAQPGRNLEIVPSFIASRGESRDLDDNEPWQETDNTDLGIDVRWGVTPSSTINATLNPDFSQVEADAAQLNVNRTFSLFFPERRPFFLDSADYFQTFANVVHTRNIGSPNAGFKFTNKSGANTTGVILADDEQTRFVVPRFDGSNVETLERKSRNAVVRYRRDFGEGSTIGAIVTAKDADNYENLLVGVDGKYRFNDMDRLRFQVLTSSTDNPEELTVAEDEDDKVVDKQQDDTAYRLRYDHNSRNWFWYSEISEYGKDFRSDLGFISKVDYDFRLLGLGRIWHGNNKTWWNRMRLNGDWDISHRLDGQLLEKEAEVYFSVNGPMQSFYEIGLLNRDQFFKEQRYDQNSISFYGELKPSSAFELGVWMRKGDAIDFDNNQNADELRVEPFVTWNIGRHLEAELEVNYHALDVAGGELFKAYSTDLRLTYQFSNRSFVRVSAQQTQIDRNVALYDEPSDTDAESNYLNRQVLYSYKITPQTVFFLGYSDGGREEDGRGRLDRDNRSVFLKFSYAWLPR